jgi:hypothetical protein
MGAPRIQSDARKAIEKKEPQEVILLKDNQPAALDYIAVDTQFFAAALMPKGEKDAPLVRRVVASIRRSAWPT